MVRGQGLPDWIDLLGCACLAEEGETKHTGTGDAYVAGGEEVGHDVVFE